MDEGHDKPIVDGPEPSGWTRLQDRLRSALGALRAGPNETPASAGEVGRRRKARRERSRKGKRGQTHAETAETAEAAEATALRKVHGPPALWMAPFFLLFAGLYAAPHLALLIQPQAPRSLLIALVATLPDWAEPLSAMLTGWLWAPWWLGLLALLLRLRAVWTAGRAVLDATGWAMAALVVEGGAWLFFGREALESFSQAEQTGAWRLLAAEFIFLFLTAVLFGPNTRQRVRFEHG